MAKLTLKNIKKVYDKDVTAVKNFNLEISDKEFVVFVGPSGCGKSTTLRMIAGLEEITEGELYIDNKLVNHVMPKDRNIAMVFQNYALYPHMTVFENLAFSLKLRRLPKKEIAKKVQEAAELLHINELLKRKPKALSGGQKQRVAIGRAIVRNPKVFLMDEPLSNLDAMLRNQMRTELIKLRERVDTTFVYVTHDQTEAMTLGDRIVIMKDGVIQQVGTPQEVFSYPCNIFVAGFIGAPQMNFLEDAVLFSKLNKYYIKVLGKILEIPKDKCVLLKDEEVSEMDVMVGIRPEHINVCEPGNDQAIEARVDVVELMGSEMLLHAQIEGQEIVIKVVQPEIINQHVSDARTHESVYFTLPGMRLHVFERETGDSLFSSKESLMRPIQH